MYSYCTENIYSIEYIYTRGDELFPVVKFKGKNLILTGHIQNELYDNKKSSEPDKVKKKIKKKEIFAQIYESIPIIRENNILLKEIAQNLQIIDFKVKSLMQGPIKIKIMK